MPNGLPISQRKILPILHEKATRAEILAAQSKILPKIAFLQRDL